MISLDIKKKPKRADRMMCDPEFKSLIKAAAAAQEKSVMDFTRDYAKKKKGVLQQLENF
ncbi:MAG: hypothetical protein ACLFTR_03445 [Candidatus Woesearchaeota archaeon]